MRNTKQNRARKVKWAKHQPGNLGSCTSPKKMDENIKEDAAKAAPSMGQLFMHYFQQRINTRKAQQAKDFAQGKEA